jgi:hypothetical protein
MTVLYHPDFAGDIRRYERQYAELSPLLGDRFRFDIDSALVAIIARPTSAGHFVITRSTILRETRRRNLTNFPFFVLYGLTDSHLFFGSVIPAASDPLSWLGRLKS